MKKYAFLSVLTGLALCVSQASASYVLNGETVVVTKPAESLPGVGPFKIDVVSTSRSFKTFCLERNESVATFVPYYTTIDTAAIFDGVPNGSDPISNATAQLYLDYRNGSLNAGGYNPNSASDNQQVQYVIWVFENDNVPPLTLNALGTAIYNAYVGYGLNDYMGGTVRVANLWTSQATAYTFGGRVQSMLTLVPEPAAIAAWTVIGLTGLALVRRRRAK